MPDIPVYLSASFVALTAILFAVTVGFVAKASGVLTQSESGARRAAAFAALVVGLWLALTALLAYRGFYANFEAMPPRILAAIGPPVVALIAFRFSHAARNFVAAVPASWLIYFQSFRVVMEFILWGLYARHLIPVQMTFEGRNFDVLSGLTAPLVGYFCFTRKGWPRWVAVLWNYMGLALLFNIVAVALLSAPTPFRQFHNEPANVLISYFPFIWLPAFVVPAALTGHILSLYQLSVKIADSRHTITGDERQSIAGSGEHRRCAGEQ